MEHSKNDDHPVLAVPPPSPPPCNLQEVITNSSIQRDTTMSHPQHQCHQRLMRIHQRAIQEISSIHHTWLKQQRCRLAANLKAKATTIATTTATKSDITTATQRRSKRTLSATESPWRIDGRQSRPQQQQIIRPGALERLHQLRQHRMALAAKMEMMKLSLLRGDDVHNHDPNNSQALLQLLRQQQQSEQQPSATTLFGTVYNTDTKPCTAQEQQHPAVHDTKRNRHENQEELLRLHDGIHSKDLWIKLRHIRQVKCLQAACRLSGISIMVRPTEHGDENNHDRLMIRFDVGHRSYHCIFDLVATSTVVEDDPSDAVWTKHANDRTGPMDTNSTSEKQDPTIFYLRLVQNTLPAAIPITTIIQRTTAVGSNGMIRLGSLVSLSPIINTRDDVTPTSSAIWSRVAEDELIMKQLRNMALQIYQACHCLQIRKEILDYLNEIAIPVSTATTTNDINVPYSIHHLECQDKSTWRSIQFRINHRLSSLADIMIVLHYSTDLCRPKAHQPTSVTIKISKENQSSFMVPLHLHRSRPHRTATTPRSQYYFYDTVVSDVDDIDRDHYDHSEFIENAILSFRRLPIQQAIQKVTDAMAEY
jgi:DNA-binding TFAR19-related protein (PDSD5 family)